LAFLEGVNILEAELTNNCLTWTIQHSFLTTNSENNVWQADKGGVRQRHFTVIYIVQPDFENCWLWLSCHVMFWLLISYAKTLLLFCLPITFWPPIYYAGYLYKYIS